jgi:hypothetical protein
MHESVSPVTQRSDFELCSVDRVSPFISVLALRRKHRPADDIRVIIAQRFSLRSEILLKIMLQNYENIVIHADEFRN